MEGRINFADPEQKKAYISFVEGLYTLHEVLHCPVLDRRSEALNKLYFVKITIVSKLTGHSVAKVHNIFKKTFIPLVKWGEEFKLTTTDMSTSQMLSYIDCIEDWTVSFFSDDSLPDELLDFTSLVNKKGSR
jgi:hypothetical protein